MASMALASSRMPPMFASCRLSILPQRAVATGSYRKFLREILRDTIMHLVVATPPLPETTGAEFLQILVAQSQVYTEK